MLLKQREGAVRLSSFAAWQLDREGPASVLINSVVNTFEHGSSIRATQRSMRATGHTAAVERIPATAKGEDYRGCKFGTLIGGGGATAMGLSPETARMKSNQYQCHPGFCSCFLTRGGCLRAHWRGLPSNPGGDRPWRLGGAGTGLTCARRVGEQGRHRAACSIGRRLPPRRRGAHACPTRPKSARTPPSAPSRAESWAEARRAANPQLRAESLALLASTWGVHIRLHPMRAPSLAGSYRPSFSRRKSSLSRILASD